MNMLSRIVSTRDGRVLRVVEAGRSDGIPVIEHHGTPDSRLLYERWIVAAQARGIRLSSYDRPGYGGSSPQPGRTVAAAAEDVAAITQALGLKRLFVWGASGGGPHALACAALLPDLVVTAATP
jgi:pimeloyl-ACP methyl ester carboxylesterase